MTLRAVHSNRAEALFGALVAALPPPDPFAPQTIVVGSHVVARWLAREIAVARGIFAGIRITMFDQFIEQTWVGKDGAAAGIRGLDRDQMAAAIASALADDRFVATWPPIAAYLAAAPEAGDRAGPRRVQLANHLAGLAWTYASTRPDWMAAFFTGRATPELATDPTARWQAAIFGEAIARLGKAAPIPMLPWLRQRAGLPPPVCPPVHVFGLSYLQRAQLEALSDLGSTTDITLYLLNPSAELWDDVSGRNSTPPKEDPLLLSLWGRALKDTLTAVIERTAGDVDQPPHSLSGSAVTLGNPRRGTHPGGAGACDLLASSGIEDALSDGVYTARDALLADTAARAAPTKRVALPAGVRILACANPRRELEAIAAAIRTHLDASPDLRANQIAVWIASDMETYLALAPSAFEAVGVPCHVIDAPVDDRGRIGEAMLAILELPTCAMARSDLLPVMTHPAVLANHPHVDAADWVRWTERLGIVHGRDASSHIGTYLADHPDKFHWDQGVRRLALGAYMVGADRGPARIANMDVFPEEVRPDQQASAATYALLVRSLAADAAWLAEHQATLLEWSEIFVALLHSYLGVGSASDARAEAARDIERVRTLLAGIARVDLDQRRVGFREARQHAVSRILSARQDRGEPLAYGVTVAPLRAHRAIPFEVTCVVGLNEGQFPASERVSPLDLRSQAGSRPGDVTARDRDRHAFFEIVLGVRRNLYASYVAVEPTSGAQLAPSSVVLELADALAPYVGVDSSREAIELLTDRYPLHRFAAGGESVPPAVVRERWAVRVRDAIANWLCARNYPVPDADGMLALLAHPSLAELRAELGIVDNPGSAGAIDPPPHSRIGSAARPSRAGAIDPPPHSRIGSAARPSRAGAIDTSLPSVAPTRSPARLDLSIAHLRTFLESPIQAWAQRVLDLDEIPDDTELDHSDEPFHIERPMRAVLLREVFGAHLRDPQTPLAAHYDTITHEFALRGQFPVGVFGAAARAADLRTMQHWREALGPIPVGAVTRIAFGRALTPMGRAALRTELVPAMELGLDERRVVRLVGTTELIVWTGDRAMSIIPLLSSVDGKSRHHLRGALDHVALAASGLSTHGHDHVLLDPERGVKRVSHEPWAAADARDYLTELARELFDAPHGYLLPFDLLARSLGRSDRTGVAFNDPTGGLGFGPIERRDGLGVPSDAQPIAQRRLGPVVARMHGDHTFEGP